MIRLGAILHYGWVELIGENTPWATVDEIRALERDVYDEWRTRQFGNKLPGRKYKKWELT